MFLLYQKKEAKNNYILEMNTKLQDPKTSAQTYGAFLSRLICNKKPQAYYHYFHVGPMSEKHREGRRYIINYKKIRSSEGSWL